MTSEYLHRDIEGHAHAISIMAYYEALPLTTDSGSYRVISEVMERIIQKYCAL